MSNKDVVILLITVFGVAAILFSIFAIINYDERNRVKRSCEKYEECIKSHDSETCVSWINIDSRACIKERLKQ